MDSKKEQFDMILEKLQCLIADQLGVDGNTITIGRTRILFWASSREQE